MKKSAIITGVNGQDGAYLAALLIENGYKVFGGVRSTLSSNLDNLSELSILDRVEIIELPMTRMVKFGSLFKSIMPDEFYNLAGLSSVFQSWQRPVETFEINMMGVLNILETIRHEKPSCRMFQASSSEMFGDSTQSVQDETTNFQPNNPYGISKLAAHNLVRSYRKSYGIFAANGILFNHESPLRPETYVSRKITKHMTEVSLGLRDCLSIGNLNIRRDWGYAPDYVDGIYSIVQHNEATDVILATGKSHSIREFIAIVAEILGLNLTWSKSGKDEIGTNQSTGQVIVKIDSSIYRPIDTPLTCGNSEKAKKLLGWNANIDLRGLAQIMVNHEKQKINQSTGVGT